MLQNLNKSNEVDIRNVYRKQGYRLVGRHSAVKICQWTKESLRNNRVCYKEMWYPPVQSHRCMMMTPYLDCNCHCRYCWRLHNKDLISRSSKESLIDLTEFDQPMQIINEAIIQRRRLLSGWKGNANVDKKKYEESLKPTMITMSLTGEPTLYPKASEFIYEANKLGIITFLVTNGTKPKTLEKMDNLPFQLYVSVSAPNKKSYLHIVRPLIKDAWEKLNQTLLLLPSLNTRKVLRLTMMKGWNMNNYGEYAHLIEKSDPDYIEIKAFEWVGQSQKRLSKKTMPYMYEIEDFAREIAKLTGYEIKGKYKPSGAILLV
jgi:tRNA wybutosine-synthesizing protein 1